MHTRHHAVPGAVVLVASDSIAFASCAGWLTFTDAGEFVRTMQL